MLIELFPQDPILYLRIVVIVILSITLHELAHGIVAISQGDDTPLKEGHITLNPFVHMGLQSIVILFFTGIAWGQMPVNPLKFRHPRWSDFFVSMAGPLSNLVLTTMAVILINLTSTYNWTLSTSFLKLMAVYNLMLFFFNIFPVPGLDGFYMLCAFFQRFKSLEGNPYSLAAIALLSVVVGAQLFGLCNSLVELFIYR
jgi:Zn-dependent protease